VVDWVYSVGPWLAALRLKPTIAVLGNTVGVKAERTVTAISCRAWHYLDTGAKVPFGEDAKFKRESYRRSVNVDIPILPQFTALAKMDFYKVVDALVISWRKFARRRA
jgi:hypothetical protein